MQRTFRLLALCLTVALLPVCAWTQSQVLKYRGTIGQRHAELTLELESGVLSAARYRADAQAGEITASEVRLIGTTIVMADDDGNLFHLHLQDGDGHTVIDFPHAKALAGTMERGEDVDLPVKLERVDQQAN